LLALTILPAAPNESITKFYYIVAILGVLNSAKIGKLALEKINTLKSREFIEAAEALGLNRWEIIGRHILWSNCLPPFIIQASLQMAEVILIEVGLCYLGVISKWGIGVTPSPSWGNILVDGSKYLVGEGWSEGWRMVVFPFLVVKYLVVGGWPKGLWMVVFPLFVIVSAILIFYFFADEINKSLAARKISLEL
jgi:ABC-type dipeptide/oligopeptide/nickel transport system permease subunit